MLYFNSYRSFDVDHQMQEACENFCIHDAVVYKMKTEIPATIKSVHSHLYLFTGKLFERIYIIFYLIPDFWALAFPKKLKTKTRVIALNLV